MYYNIIANLYKWLRPIVKLYNLCYDNFALLGDTIVQVGTFAIGRLIGLFISAKGKCRNGESLYLWISRP